MKVVTESELREIYKKAPFTSFDLPSGMKLTPAASQFLSERKIQVLRDGVSEAQLAQENKCFHISAPTPQYPKVPPIPQPLSKDGVSSGTGFHQIQQEAAKPVNPAVPFGQPTLERQHKSMEQDTTAEHMDRSHVSQEKPEHMTHLRGADLVAKTHPVIAFRGQLDVFEAVLLNGVIAAETGGFKDLAADLAELLQYARNVMRAEVRQEPLEPICICNWDAAEIRERSHYPNKFYNVNHFTPQPEHGKFMADLNYMRAIAREMELSADRAFYNEDGTTERDDILQAVNRFSSVIYVFMLQLLAGVYKYGC